MISLANVEVEGLNDRKSAGLRSLFEQNQSASFMLAIDRKAMLWTDSCCVPSFELTCGGVPESRRMGCALRAFAAARSCERPTFVHIRKHAASGAELRRCLSDFSRQLIVYRPSDNQQKMGR